MSHPLLWSVWLALPLGQAPVDFRKDVRPIFAEKCFACHGALKQKGELRVDSVKGMLEGGNNGPTIVPGKSGQSLILSHVLGADGRERMPPPKDGEAMNEKQIALLKRWIDEGAKVSGDDRPEPDPREHWAFRAPARPAVPQVASPLPIRNPIDSFVAEQWQKRGLKPQPEADRRTLLRRLHLDLVGLPPTADELDAFAKDTSADAYEKVVDRLLASPRYGERWGKHWMDIWRYSDWWGLGTEVRNSQKHMWHWRDWIIESLNADKGYDQMLREMIAADELYPNDLSKLRATGYLARPYFKFNRTTWLDETIEHWAKGTIGLTLACTKCHDHKYDPFSQLDYYRLRAFFEPYQIRMEQAVGETDFEKDGIPRVYDAHADAPTYLHIRGEERNPKKDRPLSPGLPQLLTWGKLEVRPVELPLEAHAPHLRAMVLENHLLAAAGLRKRAAELESAARKALEEAKSPPREETIPAFGAGGKVLIDDRFAGLDAARWRKGDGQWMVDQAVKQTNPKLPRSSIRSRLEAPRDFEANLTYVLTGGDPYRSVGIAFDVDGAKEILVYASGVANGNRVQVAHNIGNGAVYPAESSRPATIPLNRPIDLGIRVRGDQLNVFLDGTLILAYRLPIPRRDGKLELITYNATAEFKRFTLADLPREASIVEPGTSAVAKAPQSKMTAEEAKASLAWAEAMRAHADAQAAAAKGRWDADRGVAMKDANAKDQSKAAARLEKQVPVAKAAEDLAKLEVDFAKMGPPFAAEFAKKRAAAEEALAKARKAAEQPGETHTPLRGAVKTPESSVETEASRMAPFPKTSTGRRTALAGWMIDRKNPLTARVAVNHLWGRHLGKPIVESVFDFGRKGSPPTHPALLDWLAVEFMENGWSMKHMHRLIVTSATYRLSSSQRDADAKTIETDSENRGLWHRPAMRMEAQVVRDSLLWLAGDLDLKMGGPSIPAAEEASRRRSLYYVHSNNDQQRFLTLFDDANVKECYRRSESIVPQQALALANSQLALTMAGKIASRLGEKSAADDDRTFAHAAFGFLLGTTPTAEELDACEAAMRDWRTLTKSRPDATRRVRVNLVHALLNHNDFISIR
ncbi:MAG: PSD1 and planctomycete cytochrome C domain-containing protein [Gemmataceae bacterium]|nr:PSD1 and planctomycete cytochrome C domain-containing protein [Gemmataceae bacterium]